MSSMTRVGVLVSTRPDQNLSYRRGKYSTRVGLLREQQVAYTMKICIGSRSFWIPHQVSPSFDTRIMGSASSFKVSAIIPL